MIWFRRIKDCPDDLYSSSVLMLLSIGILGGSEERTPSLTERKSGWEL